MHYRADIDGLRAIAVVPVILFHAGLEMFSGGFVGVDVFFVISGYLITSIIVGEMAQGRFSLIRFYERRARRILPALFVVILVCFPFAWYNLPPALFEGFAESVFAVSVFLSNFLFWSESGYFDSATELKPLLHTWSLAVEEQYYVIFPLLLLGIWRFGMRVLLGVLIAITLTSLFAADYFSVRSPTATFYLLTTRAWEILIGAFCAFYLSACGLRESRWSQPISMMGFALILISIFLFDSHTPFPSFWTLIPTLGVAAIILFASSDTLVAKLLGNRVLVGIGLVSYSAYLWHQPILAFVKIRTSGDLHLPVIAATIILTFLLAYLTYRFVEGPFRRGGVSRKRLVLTLVTVFGVCNAAAWTVIHNEGFAKRLESIYDAQSRANEAALISSFTNDSGGDLPVILIVGDSYVTRWSIGISSLIDLEKYRVVSVSYLGCDVKPKPNGTGFDVELLTTGYAAYCSPLDRLINDTTVTSKIEHVFWTSHRPFEYATNLFRFDFINTLMEQVPEARLHVVGGYFQMKFPENPSCLNAMFVKKKDASVCMEMAVYPPKNYDVKAQTFSNRLTPEYNYIDPIVLLCSDPDKTQCPYEADGVPFMEDWNHLTASFLVRYLPEAVHRNASYFQEIGLGKVFTQSN